MLTEARLSVTFSTAEDILMAEDTKKDSFFFGIWLFVGDDEV